MKGSTNNVTSLLVVVAIATSLVFFPSSNQAQANQYDTDVYNTTSMEQVQQST